MHRFVAQRGGDGVVGVGEETDPLAVHGGILPRARLPGLPDIGPAAPTDHRLPDTQKRPAGRPGRAFTYVFVHCPLAA
ncbi:hypothetical protein Sxan_00560 [Streptomyces xanthophaeus]|uniref:Uncharacterized protein n=1 Tax=Streptomyces xanthophaeus TaxID=67385 RepID=A0A919GRT3_9ACTN|nr:hypothetical protein Sxan_00560 [Streptomyces xanthophaeus]